MKIPAILLASILICSGLKSGEIERMKALTKEIQILNLLNGFELTGLQRISLKKYVSDAEKLESDFEYYIDENAALFEAGLQKSIEILAEGKALPPSLKRDIFVANHEVKELHREMEEGILAIAKKVEGTLEPQQIQQLKDYVPCLIPPPGKARIGQSGTPEGFLKHLEIIRGLSERSYAKQREAIIEKAVQKKKSHMPVLAEFDEDKERLRTGDLLDEMRQMSDVDFALNKESITLKWKGKTNHKEGKNDVVRKIRSFLLDPLILKYL